MARLHEDDGSCVYLADDPAGGRVEITWLREGVVDDEGATRFVESIGGLGGVSGSSVVQVIASGVLDGRPYVVSEHVDGPSLRVAVEREGPLSGPALHRLAIATMTALVALHQAGIAHGDLHPGNVLLGPDGVRVARGGLAPAMPVAAEAATRALASIAYLAPERLGGAAPEAAADMFAWAATLVYAATGRDAFDGGSVSATINRVLGEQPALEALDEHLRAVVAACLAKDPADRPDAGDALLGLVGHSLLTVGAGQLNGMTPAVTPPPDPVAPLPPARRRRLLVGAGAVILVLAGAGGGHLGAERFSPVSSAASASPTASPDLAARVPVPAAPPAPTGKVSLPGLNMTLYENPADPLRLVAYRTARDAYYRRLAGAEFIPAGLPADDVAASPDGTWLALPSTGKVTFISRTGGERFEVAVPASAWRPTWSRDSKRLLLTLSTSDKQRRPSGFALVDVGRRTVAPVDTDEESRQGEGVYAWLPDGSGVTVTYRAGRDYGMRIRDLGGRELRSMGWVGYTTGRAMFSPSGRLFVTLCPSGGTFCAWDADTGVRRATLVITFDNSEFWGWYDENHLLVLDPRKDLQRLVAMDFLGRERRLVATVAAADNTAELFVTRARR